MTPEQDVMEVILRARTFANFGFWLWTSIYACLVFGSIVGPALAATGLFGTAATRISALVGAVAASFFATLKPNEQLTRYDTAVQMLWQTRVGYILGTIKNDEVSKQVQEAIEVMKVKYYGVQLSGDTDKIK